MSKKIPITLLFTVVITIIALIAATAVKAQEECYAGDVQMIPSPDYPFPMVLTDDTSIDGQPVRCRDEANNKAYPCYLWIVELQGN